MLCDPGNPGFRLVYFVMLDPGSSNIFVLADFVDMDHNFWQRLINDEHPADIENTALMPRGRTFW